MTKKLENASNNLREVLMWLADGEVVQYTYETIISVDTQWFDCSADGGESPYSELGLSCKWRRKPDAFETFYTVCKLNHELNGKTHKEILRMGWDARGEHKDDE